MVSVVWAAIAASTGFLVYLLVPFLGFLYPIETRLKVGRTYLKMAARCFKQFTFLRRVLSGYDVIPIRVDPEKKLLKLTLKSSHLKDDKEYQFNDPDSRIKRLYNKPVAIAYEEVPAAIDAELAELGYWLREKDMNEGIWHGDLQEDYNNVTVSPYVRMPDHLHLVDPLDAYELVPNSVDPENIKTAVQLTKQRFSRYGSRIGLQETIGTISGFIVGVGGYAGMKYVNQNLLENTGGGGGVGNPLGGVQIGGLGTVTPPPDVVWMALDAVVMLL